MHEVMKKDVKKRFLATASALSLMVCATITQSWAQQAENGVTPANLAGAENVNIIMPPPIPETVPAEKVETILDLDTGNLRLLARGPDLEALRFFAKNGEHARYRREFERLRALYPTWLPPKDLFTDNKDEQDVWDIYGTNDLAALDAAIAARKTAEPGWMPSPLLAEKIQYRRNRAELKALAEASKWREVLQVTEKSPSMIDGQDIELIWLIGQAFGETGNLDAALKSFRAALSVARNASEKGATLQKAAAYLSADTLGDFVQDVTASLTAIDDIAAIEDGLISGLLEATLRTGAALPASFDDKLQRFMARALETQDQAHIQLLAWSAFGAEAWDESNRWFEMMPDENQDPKVLEGKILSFKHKGDWLTAFEKSRSWRNISEGIGRLYINLGAPYMLPQRPEKFELDFLSDYAAKTMQLERGEGAEALGWYAYNIRQLRTAHEWFLRAAQWDETDTSAYGLVLTARAARDLDLFNQYKRIYGPAYPLIARTEFTPCGNDTPIETIYYESDEYKEWRERLEERIANQQGYDDEFRCADDIESRRVNEQRFVERVEGTGEAIAPWDVDRRQTSSFYDGGAVPPARRTERVTTRAAAPVQRVSPERTASVAPRRTTTAAPAGGSSALARAQSNKDYVTCLRLSDQLIRSGRASAKDYETRGWCLMGANRPTEAERSFEQAKSMGGGSDASYGKTLAQLRNGKTNDAHVSAANASLDPKKRRELDVEVLSQRARSAFQNRDYQSVIYALDERRKRTPEARDMMMLRGWSLYKLGYRSQAHNIMKAVDNQLSTKDSRQAVNATAR